ncbi:hypothetical protein QJQ45_000897 [Haematococcus lacustris]|nr:hypothetical protein QJQ45_000897 [Haematococcus lacustris]
MWHGAISSQGAIGGVLEHIPHGLDPVLPLGALIVAVLALCPVKFAMGRHGPRRRAALARENAIRAKLSPTELSALETALATPQQLSGDASTCWGHKRPRTCLGRSAQQQLSMDQQQLQGAQHQVAQDQQQLQHAQHQLSLNQQELQGAQHQLSVDQQLLQDGVMGAGTWGHGDKCMKLKPGVDGSIMLSIKQYAPLKQKEGPARIELQQFKLSLREVVDKLNEQMPSYIWHHFVAHHQLAVFRRQQQAVQEKGDHASSSSRQCRRRVTNDHPVQFHGVSMDGPSVIRATLMTWRSSIKARPKKSLRYDPI